MTSILPSQSIIETDHPIPNGTQAIPIPIRGPPLAAVTSAGHYDFDLVLKSGPILKRTRTTKSWRSVHLVLRPNLLSIYKDAAETKLRHKIVLSEITAVARQRDPKGKTQFVFGVFSPSRNFHFAASKEDEASEWVETIRREARIDRGDDEEEEEEEEGSDGRGRYDDEDDDEVADLGTSPVMLGKVYRVPLQGSQNQRGSTLAFSSDDADSTVINTMTGMTGLSRVRSDESTPYQKNETARSQSMVGLDYSGPENASYSDFSDAGRSTVVRFRTGNTSTTTTPARQRSVATNANIDENRTLPGGEQEQRLALQKTLEEEEARQSVIEMQEAARIVYQDWILLLKSRSGVKKWKKIWMVLRSKSLTIYKDDGEYEALKVIPLDHIVDAVEINPVSKTKKCCFQVITEDKGYRFCAPDEDGIARWLGSFKSLLIRRSLAR